jgi:hypothetical protein
MDNNERIKMKYLQMLQEATYLTLDYCISDYEKLGLTETEKQCIKDRSYTYLTMVREFNINQKKVNFKI